MAEDRTLEDAPDIVRQAHAHHREANQHISGWKKQARAWYDLVANKQWDEADVEALEDQNRIPVVINRTARAVNAIIGTQVNNRQETRFIPREMGDVQVNEILTGAADFVRDGCDAEDEESDAFEDTTTCGMGWTETRLDFEKDPEGTITIDRIDPFEMLWDTNAKKRNLADAKWVMRIRSFDADEFMARWPDADFTSAAAPWEDVIEEDGNAHNQPLPMDAYKRQQQLGGKKVNRIKVAQYQYAKREPIYRVGPNAERVDAKAFKKLKKRLDAEGIPYVKQTGVTWMQAFIAGGELLEEDVCPYPDGPTIRCITYKRDRNKNTWYGIVAAMMDPQRYGNKFLSLIMDILVKGSKGGVIMEKDAVDDPNEVEKKWAMPDALVFVRPGGINKIKDKPMPALPGGLDRLVAYFLDSVHEVTGINLELLGMANREQAGVLEHQRKQAGVTIIAPLFDGLRRYRKEQGRVLLYFIQTYLSDGRLIKITGQNGLQQFVPLAKDKALGRYDVIVDEAPTSPNMKERVFGTMAELLPTIAKMGIPIPPEILDYAPFPSVLTSKWKQMIQQQQQGASPEAMQQAQEQMGKLQQENQQLKMGREEAMMKLQMEQEKFRAEMELKWAELKAEMELEQAKAGAQLAQAQEAEQAKMQNDRELARAKLAQESELGNARLSEEARLKKLGIELENKPSVDSILEGIRAISAEQSKPRGKRRYRALRDEAGELVGAEEF